MRPLRLVRIAVEAEQLHLRHLSRRLAMRLVLAELAVLLLVAAVACAEGAVWLWLRAALAPESVALILAAANLVGAAILGVAAARWRPGRVEREARAVRQQALGSAADTLSLGVLFTRLVAMLLRQRRQPPPP